MVNRIFKQAFFAGAILAAASHADSCKEINLYDGSSDVSGHMEESSRTFPEAPEWKTNWGDFDNMKSPYIRLSGTKNYTGDWKGALLFDKLPATISNGFVQMKVRSSQNAKFGLWISGSTGTSQIHFENIGANTTQAIKVPLSRLYDKGSFHLEKIWIGLFDVPTYQYTNLFVDDISISCVESEQGQDPVDNVMVEDSDLAIGSEINLNYDFTDAKANSPVRKNLYSEEALPESKPHYSSDEQKQLGMQTSKKFVLSGIEHQQIIEFLRGQNLTPKKSREGWYKSMYLVNRNRLQDSVIANPKNIFQEADAVAASYEMRKMPLLIGDLDYSYKTCLDSACSKTRLNDYSLLVAGLPTSYTTSSKVSIFYDPYFVVSTRDILPNVEICTSKSCKLLLPKTEQILEFESAGIQKIIVKMNSGSTSIQQTLFLEVK